jgi:hypothetical protein
MAQVGQQKVNPVTRERFVWRHTDESTQGRFAEFDVHLGEGAVVAAAHVHPAQREQFRVQSGSIRNRPSYWVSPTRAGSVAWRRVMSGERAAVLARSCGVQLVNRTPASARGGRSERRG